MTGRSILQLSVLILALLLAGCTVNPYLTGIQVVPDSGTLQGAGATLQFKAVGTFSNRTHPQNTQDVTNQVTWSSSALTVATVSSTGLATGVGAGTTTITASGVNGAIVGTAELTVGDGTGPTHNLTSLTIIPAAGAQQVSLLGETAQYIAIGNFTGSPANQDMTNQVAWSSSDIRIATIDAGGLATAVGTCALFGQQKTTITAIATLSNGGVITGTSDLTVGSCGTNNLPSLTIYEFGQGTGMVVSSPGGIDCGSGAGCTGHFVLGADVTLTASPSTGAVFGGFSANCLPVVPDPGSCNKESDVTSCTCKVRMTDNATVGAIFNLAQ